MGGVCPGLRLIFRVESLMSISVCKNKLDKNAYASIKQMVEQCKFECSHKKKCLAYRDDWKGEERQITVPARTS